MRKDLKSTDPRIGEAPRIKNEGSKLSLRKFTVSRRLCFKSLKDHGDCNLFM